MYETTGNIKYLQVAIKCFGNVIDRRDDLRDQIGQPFTWDHVVLVLLVVVSSLDEAGN